MIGLIAKYDFEKVRKDFMCNELFSEYLPENFNLVCEEFDIFNDVQISKLSHTSLEKGSDPSNKKTTKKLIRRTL